MRIAFYPGSFDPPTLGHLDIIERGLALYDKLVVGVGAHPSKVAMFSEAERVAMLKDELARLGRVSDVVSYTGLTVEAACQHGAQVILRGLRDATDFAYEFQMAGMNKAMRPEIDTLLIAASPQVAHITATLVRQIAKLGGDVTPFVTPAVAARVAAKVKGG